MLSRLGTEQINPQTREIDLASPLEIAELMNAQDELVAKAVGRQKHAIAAAIEQVSQSFKQGGRLVYAGSGTSGRLGILDASECPPTFGSPPEMVQGLIAGGPEAVFRAQEGAEDSPEQGAADVRNLNLGPHDTLCGLAASGRTPYVLGAMAEARQRGAATVFVCCVKPEHLPEGLLTDILIAVEVGPEVIAGSTRLKSGTAQKMVCNMITTGAMIRLGKVWQNVMVDLQLTNQKLHERARRILVTYGGVSYDEAVSLLQQTNGHVKTALLMALGNFSEAEARLQLKRANGFIRKALTCQEKNSDE
ncbi:MAG: N-acetylmuramic acid 6-phosphate etherase [Candidatus Cyclonatronum sp.]|uniref:N-acetylmuramic acid 6-phosphate etherase n=1 Tax=Cyclonatronum sp. TaxID=3024185 RepID=UPI0025B98562|nr:N-acetylmuramic acid 6-phosphate etherase [Cyclonatronum sp.]MCH8485677.1 N-acetylmuramic acid 6-phosphate etherase [Cyclonatronum sp.]